MLLRLPDPPLALLVTGDDPPTRGGGVFDDAVFDPLDVFDCGGIGTQLLGDPGAGNMNTVADPATLTSRLGFSADDFEDTDFEIGYDGFNLIPDPVVVPVVTTLDPVT
jgi:hypothetical protein